MEPASESAATLVQRRLINMVNNRMTSAQVEQAIVNYMATHSTKTPTTPSSPGTEIPTPTSYVYDRSGVAAASWIIQHNLNRYPQVILIDDDGNMFEADVSYNSLNQITVVFSQPTSGKAVLV